MTNVTIGGANVNEYIAIGTLAIDDSIGERSVCSFTMSIQSGEFIPEVGRIVTVSTDDVLLFAGTIDSVTMAEILGTNYVRYGIECADWHQICDRRIVSEAYEQTYAGDIAQDIVDKYLAEEGIKCCASTPDDPTFTRNSVAYLSDGTEVDAGVPRFEQGKFDKAVMVEEGTTNLNGDPFFKTGISGWVRSSMTTMEWLSNVYNPWSRQNGVMRLYDNSATGASYKTFSISNTTYTVKVLLKVLKGNINLITCGGTVFYSDASCIDYTWNTSHTTRVQKPEFGENVYELTAIITPTQGKTISNYELRIAHTDNVETELYVYAVQLEAKPYATSFIDGTRAEETLTIPTEGVLNPQEGTIEFWWCPINQPASTMTGSQTAAPPIIQIGNYYQNNSWLLWCGMNDQLRLYVRGDNATGWTAIGGIIQEMEW